jgi:ubiquinone/menaquinone biosynthesis C-methylase UbiE
MKKQEKIKSYSDLINEDLKSSKIGFYNIFDSSNSIEKSFIRGYWDFSFHIMHPICNYISQPENLICLEIGYGGRRLLNAASKFFKKAIGIDIHSEKSFVENELRERGSRNIELLTTDGSLIPFKDYSIDIAYSFIVFQHLGKISVFESYLSEVFRVLKPNGIAVLYFGRNWKYSHKKSSKFILLFDKIIEKFLYPNGYIELTTPNPRDVNLKITLSFAKKTAKSYGFKLLGTLVSRRKVPDGSELYGGQYGIIISK